MKDTAVFSFGRHNPPTVGHEKLINKTIDHAREIGADHYVFTSHSQDSKKNPLSGEQKAEYIKKAFPKANVHVSNKQVSGPVQIAKHLHEKGHKHLVMVAGSDRTDEYSKLLNKYNGKDYNFKSIKVVSAGHRDPDAEGVEGMSGTKMRSAAIAGNKEKFKSGLMTGLSDKHKEEVYHHVRKALGVNEGYDPNIHLWGTPEGTEFMRSMTPGQEEEYKTSTGSYKQNPKEKSGISKKYAGDLSHSTQIARKKHWEKTSKMDTKDPKAYEPAPGDRQAKTEPSKYTKEYKRKFMESKIPFLLMNASQKKILAENNLKSDQLHFGNTTTQNFDMCPVALEKFSRLVSKTTEPEVKFMQSTAKLHQDVHDGISTKPEALKRMQFKQYLGL